MLTYVGRRLLQILPTFLGITLIAFLLLQLAPGDPIGLQSDELGPGISPEALAAWRRLKGLDAPVVLQYLHWLGSLLSFDFGSSLVDERPVRQLIAEALPRTLLVTTSALLVTYALSIPLGVYSAVNDGTRRERLLTTGLFVLYSVPAFWVALVLLVLLGGGGLWHLFPIRGLASDDIAAAPLLLRGLDLAWHLVLPVCCLAYPALARTSRYQRTAMLDVLRQDYVRAARARGLSERRVVWHHAWRNALLPMLTLLSVDLPWLVGGSVIIERIFTIRGMGMLTFEAILRRDYPVLMGVTALVAVMTMLGILAGDLALAWADPRIRLGRSDA